MTTLSGCGYNELYTLGFDSGGRAVPTPTVILPSWQDVVHVVASASHTAAQFADGHVETVGGGIYGAACDGTKEARMLTPHRASLPPLRAFAMPESHGAGITAEGVGVTWGGNIFGQAGIGAWSEGKERLSPPGAYSTAQRPAFDRALEALGGGQYHKLAIATDGSVLAWGRGGEGECADGTSKVKLVPTVTLGLDEPIIAVDGGDKHSLYLRGDGRVEASGQGRHAQFGKLGEANRLTRTLIDGLEGVLAIAAGGTRSAFLLEDGTVLVCGHDEGLHKLDVAGVATSISVGTLHYGAVVEGEAWTGGGVDGNAWGQLGDGTREAKDGPVATGVACRTLDCGVGHTVFID